MERLFFVYIMANQRHTVLYTGVTSNLKQRIYQHREKLIDGFTKQYSVTKLVYYEAAPSAASAIMREKQLKAGSRQRKIELIRGMNPYWCDLYNDI